MKLNLRIYYLSFLCCFSLNFLFSQQISINNSVLVQDLIENHLANGCVEISNVTSYLNGSIDGFSSFGSFNSGSTNFPLSNGIVIATGDAASGANTSNTTDLSQGTLNWGTDPDIELALGVTNTVNATVIEFDFIALSDVIQFNYLLASEEYYANYPCNSSDGFAFLIRESTSTGPYQNIALVPGTNTPVTVNNIHDQILGICPATNETYFQGYSLGNTNYNGRTTVLTAGSTVTPNVQYHVKLIVADQGNSKDPSYDTAVFIETNTFSPLDLGDDISTCFGTVSLNGEIQNPLATYTWFRNGSQISGETSATLNVSTSGLYRVEITISGVTCTLSDEVNVTIDTELSTNPISPYQLCDSDGDGLETFNLATKNADVVNAISNLPANYSIKYYYTDNDARNNPANNITSPIISNNNTIYVRVEDMDLGCLIFGTIALEVNTLPTITQPLDLDVCDNDGTPDTRTQIDLRTKDTEITGGQPNLVVSYHYSAADAASDSNSIPPPYTNTNPTETLYVRVQNTVTGCINSTATLTVNVTNGNTQIIRDTQFIDGCDTDHDGFDSFDLTSIINTILNGETGFFPPTFHTSQNDAELGINAIPDPTNFQNTIIEEQTLFVRFVDSTTGCYAIVPIEVHSNLLLTATDHGEFALCDEDDGKDFVDFDLFTIENYIANGLPNVIVTFFENQSDLTANSNPLDKNVLYPVSTTLPKTLYIKIEDGNCTEETDIILRVNPILLFNPLAPLSYCDDDNDGTVNVELASFNDEITGGNTDFTVTYYASEFDAESSFPELQPYHPVTNQATIWARIENVNSSCSSVNSFDITIVPAPVTTQPNDIIICDADGNGVSTIKLEDIIDDIVSDRTGLTIEFYTSLSNANSNTAPLNKNAFDAVTQPLFVRVDNSECSNIQQFDVIVNTLPNIPTITTFTKCEDDDNQIENFILAEKDPEILNGQSGKVVYYFEDEIDATNRNLANAIPKNNNYSNTSSTQTIWVRVENITDADCFSTSSFTLEVKSNPKYNTNFTDFPPVCQTTLGNHTFDLATKRQEIAQGSTDNLIINFYLSLNDATNNTGTPLPDQFTYSELQGQFYVRIENAINSCAIIDEVRFITFPTPHIVSVSIAPVCDTDYDGSTTIDLTTAVYNIENVRFSDTDISYFEDFELTTQIPASQINNYPVTTTKTIYAKAEITQTMCYDVAPLVLNVNLPPAINTIGTIQICDNDTNTYDLSEVNSMLVNNTNNVTITYHNTQTNANSGAVPIGSVYNYTGSNHTIYARIANSTTSCFVTEAFTLQINPNPIANTPPNLISCDDDFDGFYEFDLSANSNPIIGTQNSSLLAVTYYDRLQDAESKSNPLNNLHSAFNGDVIFARLENINTLCYDITQFSTIVNPLPIIPIEDVIPMCINNLPLVIDAYTGNPNDTYLWSNGATTAQIILTNSSEIGNYWVTATTPHSISSNCSNSKNFTVIESEDATINLTTTVDFADPNSITVNISGIGNYVFILDGGEPQTSNVFENVTLGVHTVTVRDLNGCSDVTTEVFVIDIPKFFTPNNDSYFDTWHIVGINQLPGTVINVYNRYGKLIKTLLHTSEGWNGTYNGENMPADDYWFVAKIIQNGNPFEIKGHFALKR